MVESSTLLEAQAALHVEKVIVEAAIAGDVGGLARPAARSRRSAGW